ncbi:hypothetical protein LINPERPRIM_LOCUS22147 [Linum perenne]
MATRDQYFSLVPR